MTTSEEWLEKIRGYAPPERPIRFKDDPPLPAPEPRDLPRTGGVNGATAATVVAAPETPASRKGA